MKLQQLKYLAAVAENGLNISAAAERLHTSQPGVSKQLKLLEEELGFQIFTRSGRNLLKITPAGEQVIKRAEKILQEVENIRRLGAEMREDREGSISLATTHTQARYVLPQVIKRFRRRYPNVNLHLHQGTSEQIAEMAARGQIDFAIATGSRDLFQDMVLLPCYTWFRRIIVPLDHELAGNAHPTISDIASYPIVTYVFSLTGPSSLKDAFKREGLTPNVTFTARDADVIKTYVRLGLGIGIVAEMAYDPEQDDDLVSLDATRLFAQHTTWIGFPRGTFLRGFMYDFLQLFAPHLNQHTVDEAGDAADQDKVDKIFEHTDLPAIAGQREAPI